MDPQRAGGNVSLLNPNDWQRSFYCVRHDRTCRSGMVFDIIQEKRMKKPVTPAAHGLIDYVFSGLQLAAAPLLHLNNKTTRTYQALGAGFTLVNALTKTPVGIKPLIPFKGHQKADLGFLAGLTLLSFAPFIRKDRSARIFHLSFLTIALLHYALTDYDSRS